MASDEVELKGWMVAGLQGDEGSYQKLLDRLTARLRAYYKSRLFRLGANTAEAEDLVQDALIAIHTRRHTYDSKQPLMPWVNAIAHYKLVDHFRRTRDLRSGLALDGADAALAHDDHLATESTYDVETLLRRLPRKMERAIRSVKLEGLTVGEASRGLGQTEAAVRVSVHRGLKALAAMVAREKKA